MAVENGHRSVTYQHFAGPASVVLKCSEKGSEDLYDFSYFIQYKFMNFQLMTHA